MVTYETFKSLGIQVDIRPELEMKRSTWYWPELDDQFPGANRIGMALTPTMVTKEGVEADIETYLEQFAHEKLYVKWLNGPVHDNKNFQLTWMAVSLSYLDL
jgi:CO dehydrogenase/acetyl-CoA synthase beta subunit